MMLCTECNGRMGKKFREGPCGICGNAMEKAKAAISSFDFNKHGIKGAKTFSIETAIGKDIMIREEDAFDFCFGESIKRQLNRTFADAAIKSTGMAQDADDPDVIFITSLDNGRIYRRPGPMFLFGRYKKLEPQVAQKIWHLPVFASVEELIGEPMKKAAEAENFTMHASGREDIDVTNTAGRPFVMELMGAANREISLTGLEKEINKDKRISVKLERRVPRSFVAFVSDSHFDKEYRAYISAKEGIDKRDMEKICAIGGKTISQKNPERMMRRRANLERKRKVYSITAGKDGKGYYADIECEAGTYVKELVNGDNGRTQPSFSSATNKNMACESLVVTRIRDRFLDTVL